MDQCISLSRFCEVSKYLLNIKQITAYRFFRFSRASTDRGFLSYLRYTVDDDWMNWRAGLKGAHAYFLSKFPDLKDPSVEFLVCPLYKDEVKLCVHSEETRILPSSQLRDVLDLLDITCWKKALNVHWELNSVVYGRAVNIR